MSLIYENTVLHLQSKSIITLSESLMHSLPSAFHSRMHEKSAILVNSRVSGVAWEAGSS